MQDDQNSDSEDGKGDRVPIDVEGDDEVIQEKPLPSLSYLLQQSTCRIVTRITHVSN
jgi:hypothetical protein